MERTTDKRLGYLLGRIAEATGKRTGETWQTTPDGKRESIPGTIFIEKNDPGDSRYRYRITEITNEHGGEGHPFGHHMYSRGEMDAVMNFACIVLEQTNAHQAR